MSSSSPALSAHHGLLNHDSLEIRSFYGEIASKFVEAEDDILLPVTELLFVKQHHKLSKHEYLVAVVKAKDDTTHYVFFERRSSRDPSPTTASQGQPQGPPSTAPPQTAAAAIADGPPTSPSQAMNVIDRSQPRGDLTATRVATAEGQPQDAPSTSRLDAAAVGNVNDLPSEPLPAVTTVKRVIQNLAPSAPRRFLTHGGVFMKFTKLLFSSASKGAPRKASDTISITGNRLKHENDTIIGMLKCDRRPVYLHDLVCIALMVHDSDLSYELIGSNCYWYAGSITAILEKEFDYQMEQVGPTPTNSIFGWLRRDSDRRGKYLDFTVFVRPSEEELGEARKYLEGYQNRFQDKVNAGRRPAIKAREEARKAEEETRKAQEETRKAQEEIVLEREVRENMQREMEVRIKLLEGELEARAMNTAQGH